MTDRCIYCGSKAERWCDFVIGFTDPDADGLFSFADGEVVRCDAPLCAAHSVNVGQFHASGKAGWSETIDHCAGHKTEENWLPITADEAERVRYRHKCTAAGGLRLIATGQAQRLQRLQAQ